ncbi:MAG TPA: aminoglycoside phosphotransferase family protein [Nocardioides sp.]|nr:aminoglycoside phosphotransferase family protein [Nocardioides sp.]
MPDDDVPDLGPVPTRLPVTEDLTRRLVAAQFPQWADLPIRRVASEGWDNRTFHLGAEMSVRLPSAAPYALAVEKEHRWLPALAPRLPLQIPVPLAKGAPGEGYPFVWSVYRWLDGEPASRDNVADLTAFGAAVADFLAALQRIDPTDGPGPGLHNWYRGGTLATYDALTQGALETLEGHCHTDLAREIWRTALNARWDGGPVWIHGDIAKGNLLVDDGLLTAVIDFGTCGVGDPACDLAIAWTLLDDEGRTAFRRGLSVDDETWLRGRGWALWKTLVTCAGALESGGPELAAATYVLDQIFEEYV